MLKKQQDSQCAYISALQPKLWRFASVLAGDATARDRLMEHCHTFASANEKKLAANASTLKRLFSEIYSAWLQKLKESGKEAARADERSKARRFFAQEMGRYGARVSPEIPAFIATLPPQQRVALLLVYGENMSHEEAASVLDSPVDCIVHAVTASRSGLLKTAPPEHNSMSGDRLSNKLYDKTRG